MQSGLPEQMAWHSTAVLEKLGMGPTLQDTVGSRLCHWSAWRVMCFEAQLGVKSRDLIVKSIHLNQNSRGVQSPTLGCWAALPY